MEASVFNERKHAFVLKQSGLKKIWDLFEARIGSVSVETGCADGIDRKFSDWKQLTAFDNPPQKQIVSLSIDARADNWSKSANLRFSKSSWRSIELRLQGTEQVVSRLYNDINDILDGVRPWYSMFARIDFFYIIGFICWFAFMVFMVSLPNKPTNAWEGLPIEKAILAVIIFICVFLVPAIFIWLLNKLRVRFFPCATFALGQGEQRYHLDEKIRWSIVIGFVVSLVASLIASLI
jgi:hypothetical protein